MSRQSNYNAVRRPDSEAYWRGRRDYRDNVWILCPYRRQALRMEWQRGQDEERESD